MADRGWKKAERVFARDVGTQRIPVTGERAGADFVAPPFCYQLKVRRVLPRFLFEWLAGICANAAAHGHTGVLVVNRPHYPRADALVILRWADWCQTHGAPLVRLDAAEPRDTITQTPTGRIHDAT